MIINFELFTKKVLPNLFYFQFCVLYLVYILALILTYNTYSPIITTLSMMILFVYSYFIHILFHNLPDKINIHLLFHHNHTENNFKFIINLMIELITNIMFFVFFYILQNLTNIHFVPNILILYYSILYISVHIINYSIFHLGNNHHLHHLSSDKKQNACNYGPDLLDHFFNTSCDNKYENYCHIIPNVLLAFLITYYIYKPKIF